MGTNVYGDDQVRSRTVIGAAGRRIKQRVRLDFKVCYLLVVLEQDIEGILAGSRRFVADKLVCIARSTERVDDRFQAVIYIASRDDAAWNVTVQKQYA